MSPASPSLTAFLRAATVAAVLALAIVAGPRPAEPQSPSRVPRIGMLWTYSPELPGPKRLLDAFREGLRERGYTERQNVVLEHRSADGKSERLPELAAELVRLKVDVIVAPTTPAAHAATRATRTIPIVAATMADPVNDGLVGSLARPGGNVTGLTFLGPEIVGKRVELLKAAAPGIARVAALVHPGVYGERTTKEMLKEAATAARVLGLRLQLVEARGPEEFDRAFAAVLAERADALIVLPSPIYFNERQRLVALAARHRLLTMYPYREAVDDGGLIGYGPDIRDLFRRAATYADKILKGAKPAELPVEQASTFELVINLATARTLGLTIPRSMLLRADVID